MLRWSNWRPRYASAEDRNPKTMPWKSNLEFKLITAAVDRGGEGKIFKGFCSFTYRRQIHQLINLYTPPWTTTNTTTSCILIKMKLSIHHTKYATNQKDKISRRLQIQEKGEFRQNGDAHLLTKTEPTKCSTIA